MNIIDYVIIGVIIIISIIIIVRRVTGKSKSCECSGIDCAKCKKALKSDKDKNDS